MVRPFLLSLTTTSDTVPVSDPSGSPLARAAAEGGGTFLMSWSVIITGGGAGAAAGAAPGAAGAAAAGSGAGGVAGAWAHASDTIRRATAKIAMRRVIVMILS